MSLFVIVAFVISMAQGPHMEISSHIYVTEDACNVDAMEVSAGYKMEGSKAFVECLPLPGDKA